jgi:hypothetical protein
MAGGAPPASVNFSVERQVQGNWCWAAVSSCVANYFTPGSWTQCRVASAEMNALCCQDGGSDECDRTHFLERALARVGRFRAVRRVLPRSTVEAELRNGRPLPIRVGWNNGAPNGGGHFLAIRGSTPYGPSDTLFELTDPIYGASSIGGHALAHGGYQQGAGRWTHSYFVG